MKKILLILLLCSASAWATDVKITDSIYGNDILSNNRGQQRVGMASDGRVYVLWMRDAVGDDYLRVWTASDFTTFDSLLPAHPKYINFWGSQMIGDTFFVYSTGGSSGTNRRISKMFETTRLNASPYYDSLDYANGGGWYPATIVLYRNDSSFSALDTSNSRLTLLRSGTPVLDDNSMSWTAGTIADVHANRYKTVAVDSSLLVWDATGYDVFATDGYGWDTLSTNWPGMTLEGSTDLLTYSNIISSGKNDTLVFVVGEVQGGTMDSIVVFRAKVTKTGYAYTFTPIDSAAVIGRGKLPQSDIPLTFSYPTVTVLGDTLYCFYKSWADTSNYDNQSINFKKAPIRGAAGTMLFSGETEIRPATGNDSIYYMQAPQITYGDTLAVFWQKGDPTSAGSWKLYETYYPIEASSPPSSPTTQTVIRSSVIRSGVVR